MAISTTGYISPHGVEIKYWKVCGVNINPYYKWADVQLMGFATEEARQEGKECLQSLRMKITGAYYTQYFDDAVLKESGTSPACMAYKYIQENELAFKDSVSC